MRSVKNSSTNSFNLVERGFISTRYFLGQLYDFENAVSLPEFIEDAVHNVQQAASLPTELIANE